MATMVNTGGGGSAGPERIAVDRTFSYAGGYNNQFTEPSTCTAPVSAVRYDKKIAMMGTYGFSATYLDSNLNVIGKHLNDANILHPPTNSTYMIWGDYSTETEKLYLSLNNDASYPIRVYSASTTYNTFTPNTAIDSNYGDVATIANQILRPIMYLENDYVVVMRFHTSTRQPRLYLYKLTGTTAQQKQVIDATLPTNPTGYTGAVFHKFKFKNDKIVLAIRFSNNLAFISFDFVDNQIKNLHAVWDTQPSTTFDTITINGHGHYAFKDRNHDLYLTENWYVTSNVLRVVYKLSFNESTYRIEATKVGFIPFPFYLSITDQAMSNTSGRYFLPRGAILDNGVDPILISYEAPSDGSLNIMRITAWEAKIQTF